MEKEKLYQIRIAYNLVESKHSLISSDMYDLKEMIKDFMKTMKSKYFPSII